MRLKHKVNQIQEDTWNAFKEVERDVSFLTKGINDFYNLRDELATNGVVRDIRKLQKDMKAVMDGLAGLREYTEEKFEELDRNGVATAINEVSEQVFLKTTKREDGLSGLRSLMGMPESKSEDPTLAGKVDAIIEHLGLDVTVKPEEVIESKVVAKKQKPAKKKGKR